MELTQPRHGAEVQFGRVVKQLRDKGGLPIGTVHDNSILDTRLYKVEFLQDCHKVSMAANAIAENLFAQVNNEGESACTLCRNCRPQNKRKAADTTRCLRHQMPAARN